MVMFSGGEVDGEHGVVGDGVDRGVASVRGVVGSAADVENESNVGVERAGIDGADEIPLAIDREVIIQGCVEFGAVDELRAI